MSIEYYEDSYNVICDFCYEAEAVDGDFDDAVQFKKDNGWKSIKTKGDWLDMCPACRKENVK